MTMKKIIQFSTLFNALLLLSLFSMTGCLKDECEETRRFIEYQPVYVQPHQFRIDITATQARELRNTGKIYVYGDYLFINELREGVHVFDNSDPSSPVNAGFIVIPGNVDISIRNNVLYADSYTDLLAIDISEITDPRLTCRLEEVFRFYHFDENLGYYVYDRVTERSIEVECGDPRFNQDRFFDGGLIFVAENASADASGAPSVTGTGGSLARFTISKDFLYAIDNTELHTFDLSVAAKPNQTNTVYVNWGIETLFPFKDYLFIGANAGMFIYNNLDPSNPQYVAEFRHARACDPVFVQGDYAYVTLRDGSFCESFTNQLDVIDISSIYSPYLVASYEMDNPHGLSVRGDYLYLCEGDYGLKVFDKSDPLKIEDRKKDHVKNIHATDVISLAEDHLLVIGKEGLMQYDATDKDDLKEISRISVSN